MRGSENSRVSENQIREPALQEDSRLSLQVSALQYRRSEEPASKSVLPGVFVLCFCPKWGRHENRGHAAGAAVGPPRPRPVPGADRGLAASPVTWVWASFPPSLDAAHRRRGPGRAATWHGDAAWVGEASAPRVGRPSFSSHQPSTSHTFFTPPSTPTPISPLLHHPQPPSMALQMMTGS